MILRAKQRVTQSVTFVAVLVIALVCGACARPAPFRPYQPGAFSADASEAMVTSLYRAHKAGYLTVAQMGAVERAYQDYQRAQRAYVDAVAKDRVTADLKQEVDTRLQAIKDLAMAYGIY